MSESLSPDLALMRALGFTADDLAANRAGQLSEMQLYWLRVRRRRSIFTGLIIILVLVFIASLFIFLGQREGGSIILAFIGIGLMLCNAALVGVFARHWLRLSADLREKSVQTTTGPLERVIKPVGRRVLNYAIRVDDIELFVSKEVFDIFVHQAPYTIYRASYTGALLSVERKE